MAAFLPLFFACSEEGKEAPATEAPVVEVPQEEPENDVVLVTRGKLPDILEVNDFSFGLLQAVSEAEEGENLLISPLSAAFPLAMLSNGATEEKAGALHRLLGYEGVAQEEMNAHFKNLKNLVSADEGLIVEQTTVAWTDFLFPLLPAFTESMQVFYEAEVKQNDFADPATLDLINGWVSERTHGLIPQLLDELVCNVYLIHTLYFKGLWASPFDPTYTENEAFANADGSLSTLPTMYQKTYSYAYQGDSFDALELDYQGGEYSMVVFLPHEGEGLAVVEDHLNSAGFRDILSGMYLYEASVKLPRFMLKDKQELKAVLEDMAGQELISGDYSLINPSLKDALLQVVQKTFAEINEAGTEAAAVTYVGIFGSTGPVTYPEIEFHVNRPFLFLIHEKSTGAILFAGKVLNL